MFFLDMTQSRYEKIAARTALVRHQPAREESLERFRAALAELEQTRGLKIAQVTLIAGTNGKGTVAKTLEQLTLKLNSSTGLYTSPHMIEPTERIRSHGKELSRDEFVATFEALEPLIVKYELSHFEILTLMMAEVFFGDRIRSAVERAVIEVGVGGRFDPTSLFDHDTSVVTQLGLDHVDLLGGSLEKIASEKLAIVKPENIFVHAPFPLRISPQPQPRARKIIEAPSFAYHVDQSQNDPRWIIETPWGEAPLALLGQRAVENTTIALKVLEAQGFDPTSLLPELAHIEWPCRMEKFVRDGKRIYLSGDHNPQGIDSLSEILKELNYERLFVIVGIGKNKNQPEMLEKLPRSHLMLTTTPFRSARLEDYGEWLDKAEASDPDPVRLLELAVATALSRDLILVTGSLYLAGHLRRHLIRGAQS